MVASGTALFDTVGTNIWEMIVGGFGAIWPFLAVLIGVFLVWKFVRRNVGSSKR